MMKRTPPVEAGSKLSSVIKRCDELEEGITPGRDVSVAKEKIMVPRNWTHPEWNDRERA